MVYSKGEGKKMVKKFVVCDIGRGVGACRDITRHLGIKDDTKSKDFRRNIGPKGFTTVF